MSKLAGLKNSWKFVVAGLILFYLVRFIYTNWSAVRQYEWQFNYGLLFVSLSLVMLNLIFLIQIWRRILLKLGYSLRFTKAFKILFYSNTGRYLPGKIWSILGMIYMCEKEGIPHAASFTSAILYQALNIIAGMILVVVISGTGLIKDLSKFIYLPLALILIAFVYPPIMEKSVNILLKLMKRKPIKISLSFGHNIVLVLLLMLSWCVYGAGFNILISSFTGHSLSSWPYMISTFTFSYIIGLLSVFVPGGLGVREGILISYLLIYFPLPIATVIALFSRLWMMAVEIVGLLVSTRL